MESPPFLKVHQGATIMIEPLFNVSNTEGSQRMRHSQGSLLEEHVPLSGMNSSKTPKDMSSDSRNVLSSSRQTQNQDPRRIESIDEFQLDPSWPDKISTRKQQNWFCRRALHLRLQELRVQIMQWCKSSLLQKRSWNILQIWKRLTVLLQKF